MMRVHIRFLVVFASVAAWSCADRQGSDRAAFSQEDYVTESYLSYQDSLVHAWNTMMSDDNEKLSALHELLTEMRTANDLNNPEMVARFEERLAQLHRIRYTQKSMSNADVIEEYDFASTSLIREILAFAETSPLYAENLRMPRLVDQVRLAEERIGNYRADYDDLVSHYNSFLDENRTYLVQMDRDSLRKKPVFELVSIE